MHKTKGQTKLKSLKRWQLVTKFRILFSIVEVVIGLSSRNLSTSISEEINPTDGSYIYEQLAPVKIEALSGTI